MKLLGLVAALWVLTVPNNADADVFASGRSIPLRFKRDATLLKLGASGLGYRSILTAMDYLTMSSVSMVWTPRTRKTLTETRSQTSRNFRSERKSSMRILTMTELPTMLRLKRGRTETTPGFPESHFLERMRNMTKQIRYSKEIRERCVRLARDVENQCSSSWAATVSVAQKVGCSPQTLHSWIKSAELEDGKGQAPSRTESCMGSSRFVGFFQLPNLTTTSGEKAVWTPKDAPHVQNKITFSKREFRKSWTIASGYMES